MAYGERSKGKLTGRWCADVTYKYAGGLVKRYHKAFASKGEAEGFEAYVRATGEVPPGVLGKPENSFASVVDRMRTREPGWLLERNTAQRIAFALTHLGAIDVRAIRTQQLEKYVDTIQARCGQGDNPPANNTVNNYLSVVGKVLAYAHRLDMIEGVPAIPRLSMNGKKRAALSVGTENAVCAWMQANGKGTSAFLVHVLAGTGVRLGELYALRPEQIETPERIEHTGFSLTSEQTKTNEARWVPILPGAAKKLRALIASKRLPKPARLYSDFKQAVTSLGDGQDLTLHCLRHTTATRLASVCENALLVAKLLGHSTGLMTSRYFHPEKEVLFEVAKKVQNGLGEMPQTGEVVMLQTPAAQALSASRSA